MATEQRGTKPAGRYASAAAQHIKDNRLSIWAADAPGRVGAAGEQGSKAQDPVVALRETYTNAHDPANPYRNEKENAGGAQTPAYGGGYSTNPYTAQANALYQQLLERGEFRYDLQGDMLYRQYADQYSQLGKTAMRDAMGTAAGLTGGYGNSYAQQVGSQAYQQYLGQLNGMIPEFYDRAYQRWLDQGAAMQDKYALAMNQAAGYGGGGGGGASTAGTAAQGTAAAANGQGAKPSAEDLERQKTNPHNMNDYYKPLNFEYYMEQLKQRGLFP